MAEVTLHVGAGTFQPVRAEDLDAHRMHEERLRVGPEVCAQVEAARARGGRVVAVGTTSVRSLESAAAQGPLGPFEGSTRLFIRPGYRFRVVDALITNFHLPDSTLIMLVAAFAGYRETLASYRHAIGQGYRFFSYGDAMFLTRKGWMLQGREIAAFLVSEPVGAGTSRFQGLQGMTAAALWLVRTGCCPEGA